MSLLLFILTRKGKEVNFLKIFEFFILLKAFFSVITKKICMLK